MGLAHFPKIASDGLIFAIDAANPKCFTAGNTHCKNIITGGLVTGASGTPNAGAHTPNTANFPAFNSIGGGVFDFAGGRGMNVEEDLGAHTEFTLALWFYKDTAATTQYITDGRNNGGQWFLTNYVFANINYHGALRYNYGSPYVTGPADFIGKWTYLVVTSNPSTATLYLNGTEVPNYDTRVSVDEDLGVNYRIGTRYTTSGQWTGYMNNVYIYNRALTAAEVELNFNATRMRYGI